MKGKKELENHLTAEEKSKPSDGMKKNYQAIWPLYICKANGWMTEFNGFFHTG